MTKRRVNTSTSQPQPSQASQPQAQPQVSVTASSQPQPTQTTFKPGKKKSEVWKHFHYKMNEDGTYFMPVMAVCNYCKVKEYPCGSRSYGTANMRHHMFNACLESPVRVDKRDPKQTLLANNLKGELVPLHYDKDFAKKKLIEMIIIDELPFNMVEAAGFRAFCQAVNPQFLVPCRKTVALDVMSCFLEEKAKLQSILSVGTRVSLTMDTWTSIQNINYMVLTAHFIDDDWNLHKRIISFCQIANHKGETIAKALETCLLGDWGIEKVFTIAVDNATASEKAIEIFKGRLARSKGLVYNGAHLHMRCCCHVLNLIVRDGMSALNDLIQPIRLGVKWVRSSPQRLEKFREFAHGEGIGGLPIVCMDVCTRWNSTYLMLEQALKFSRVFDRLGLMDSGFQDYFKDHDNTRCLNTLDWENAKEFVSYLKVFYETTLKLSASETPTAHLVFKKLLAIQVLLEKETKKPSFEVLHKVAASMKKKFDKYWGKWENVNRFIYLAVVLDPRYKLSYVGFHLRDIGMDNLMVERLQGEVKQMLIDLFKEYGQMGPRRNQPNDDGGDDGDEQGDSNEEGSSDDGEEDEDDIRYHQYLRENQVAALSDEVDRYLLEPHLELKKNKLKLLPYWKAKSARFPILAKIAKDIFAMPVSSVASEYAFSLGVRVVDPFRSSLTPKMVEALICTNDWLKADRFSLYKEPTQDELELYSTLEEVENEVLALQNVQGNPPPAPTTSGPSGEATQSSIQASTTT